MITIHKYDLNPGLELQKFAVPTYYRALSVHIQNNIPRLWVLLDTSMPKKTVMGIYQVYTGDGFSINPDRLNFIGTYLFHDRALVVHVFEKVCY